MFSAFWVAGDLNRFSSLLYLSSLPTYRVDFHQDPVSGNIVVSERKPIYDYNQQRNVHLYHLKINPKRFLLL